MLLSIAQRHVSGTNKMPNTPRLKRNETEHNVEPAARHSSPSSYLRARECSMREFIQLHNATVPYVRQSYTWDCGLACVEMALRARGVKQSSFWELRKKCTTYSVWSIDIAYLLHSYNLDTVFFTTKRGVRAEYKKQDFYKQHFPADRKRVTDLFSNAEEKGITVIERQVDLSEIRKAVLEENRLVLVLLDKRLLKCSICDKSRIPYRNFFSSYWYPNYLGHYVLIYAYHPGTDKFLMKDPASLRETCVISADTLEEARLAFGTDQDILFIGERERDSITS